MSRFKYGVSCALEDVPEQWPITLRGDIEEITKKASQYGYEAIELQLCNPDRYDWKHIKAVADQMGMSFCADATGRELMENKLSLISEDAGVRRNAIDRLKQHADVCAVLGCPVILGTMRSNIPSPDKRDWCIERLDEATCEVADYAKQKNVRVLVENITSHITNYLCGIFEVADYVKRLGKDNIGIHLDTYSMLQEDNDIAGAIEYCGDKLWYVHFADSGRFYPGGGNVDFKTFLKELMKSGYKGIITTECKPYPTPELCAEYGIRYIKAMEIVAEIESIPRVKKGK